MANGRETEIEIDIEIEASAGRWGASGRGKIERRKEEREAAVEE